MYTHVCKTAFCSTALQRVRVLMRRKCLTYKKQCKSKHSSWILYIFVKNIGLLLVAYWLSLIAGTWFSSASLEIYMQKLWPLFKFENQLTCFLIASHEQLVFFFTDWTIFSLIFMNHLYEAVMNQSWIYHETSWTLHKVPEVMNFISLKQIMQF